MQNFYIENLINSGSYGEIYKCKSNIVVKKIPNRRNGISNLLELVIMNSFDFLYLNKSIQIIIHNNFTYIFQEEALCDLYKYCKNNKISINDKYNWIWQLSKAVQILHKHNIIHGDIKLKNILIYNNNSIKLNDFGMSIIYNENNEINYNLGTNTHRSLENFLKKPLTLKFDIWSLGCTIYHLFFGNKLFPDQRDDGDKEITNKKYINCLIDWNDNGPIKQNKLNIGYYHIDYNHFQLNPLINKYVDLKNCLFQMLIINPEKRININSLLNMNIFNKINKPVEYSIKTHNIIKIENEEFKNYNNFERKILNYIYYNINNQDISNNDKINITKILMNKLINQNNIFINNNQINLEKIIVEQLNYNLLTI